MTAPIGDGRLVLIVEDNEKNLKLARDLLQYHGFRTIEATDAETGLRMAAESLPDIILMDIELPGMDGVTALQRLREEAVTAAHAFNRRTAIQSADYEEIASESGQFVQDRRQLLWKWPGRCRRPVIHHDAVGNVNIGKPFRDLCRIEGASKSGHHAVQERQSQCRSNAAQECSAGNGSLEYHHDSRDLLI